MRRLLSVLIGLFLLCMLAPVTSAGGVTSLFDLTTPDTAPFPSDVFTVPDPGQNTGHRVNLPRPNCLTNPSDCADLDIINALDGFNVQPRISIPFSGPIDVSTVSSQTVFLVKLGSTPSAGHGSATVSGINQIVWDVATNTLHATANDLLEQHTRYALIVTNGVRDASGNPLGAGDFDRFRHDANFGQTKDPGLKAYREALLAGLAASGIPPANVVVASIFTTQSVTAFLEKVRTQIRAAAPPAPADFLLGPNGTRTVFPMATVTSIAVRRQVTTTTPPVLAIGVPLIQFLGPHVAATAFGKYVSPDYTGAGGVIPEIATRTGQPVVQRMNEIYFNLHTPVGPKPPSGWPVAIFIHGGSGSKQIAMAVTGPLAAHGIAVIAINAPGNGFGPLGTVTVNRTDGPSVTFPTGGRGVDVNGDHQITAFEGCTAAPPNDIVLANRDCIRQTAIDLMQLVRVIEAGVDIDGDGIPDLDPSRIYLYGQSLGAAVTFATVPFEPDIRAAVPNSVGGPFVDNSRLLLGAVSGNRDTFLGIPLSQRVPSLINVGGVTFNENMPLRDQPPVINTVPGAMALQQLFDRAAWASRSGDPVALAPYILLSPLPGQGPKPFLFQFAKGDETAPNPLETAVARAGDLAQQTTYFRNDLAFVAFPALPKNPHLFIYPFDGTGALVPAKVPFAVGTQEQIATFFASDGAMVIQPPGVETFFEVPIVPPLPETLNYLP